MQAWRRWWQAGRVTVAIGLLHARETHTRRRGEVRHAAAQVAGKQRAGGQAGRGPPPTVDAVQDGFQVVSLPGVLCRQYKPTHNRT